MLLPQQNPIDATLPQAFSIEDAPGWPLEVGDMLDALFNPASPPLLAMGNNLWTGLASIVVVWTGARIAFAGASFRPWELITLAIGLTIPLGMLRFYAVDVPGMGMPFPQIIPAGADQIAQAFHADMATEMHLATAEFNEGLRQNLAAERTREGLGLLLDLPGLFTALLQNGVAVISTFLWGAVFSISFLLIYALCLAQVIWAQVALGILVYLGPVMIPWLVWQPMAWLFWGWFRAIWKYAFYSIIAAAVLRVFTAICISMIESMNATIGAGLNPVEGPEFSNYLAAIIPLLAAAFMAAMKVPELAGALVGSSGGRGIAGAAAMAMTAGKARLTRVAAGGVT